MKRFLVKVLFYLSIIYIIDCLSGILFPYLVKNAQGGDNGRNNYICDLTNEDILIFGSSRAIHHYNPRIISDSTKLSCYNCGQDGCGIILNYARLKLIKQRYSPRVIIYDIIPKFDIYEGIDNHQYLTWLKAYYDRDGIAEVFDDVDTTESIKMLSNLYRYNSKFIQILSDYFKPLQSTGINGYRPLIGNLENIPINRDENDNQFDIDTLKIKYFRSFINDSKESKVFFVVSPIYNGFDSVQFEPIRMLCKECGIPFINFGNHPKYFHNPNYFKDSGHLNSKGADEFSKDIIRELKRIKNKIGFVSPERRYEAPTVARPPQM